ncbi:coiled-coil domain-containing protein 141 isoform X2 [Trachinotus anak]|uniref:coiled-coil domain-containing protein 141 isoform X2 n=1 Tax=Trachinotus anak TaxID=443729 RepID=UPI0039F17F47
MVQSLLMMPGETEETGTCGGQEVGKMMGGGGGGNMKLPRSFTTLSTIAIQAGQSQIVVSVLRSGSLVHLQLVQVHPGLCEIGSNQEENQRLIQEQQQLMDKLKQHESEVLAAVENGRQTEQRRKRRDEGMMEQKRNKKKEEEEEVYKAMGVSLSEGWSLLLRLLERRQEVLMLASDFYSRALEFADSIDRVEGLQIRPDDRLTEVQIKYDSMRRDLLGKSLQVLTSSNILLQNLRKLQRTEALQRRGGVLQDEEDEEGESYQGSRGVALRLEELVETLQDRRRRVDKDIRLQLQQAENGIMVHKKHQEPRTAGSDDWTLTVYKILAENLLSESPSAESTGLQLDSTTGETRDLQSGTRAEETTNFESESRSDLDPESMSDLKPGSKLDVKPGLRSEKTRHLQPGSREDPEDVSLSELSRKQEETGKHRPATASGQVESMLGKESQSGEDQAHQTLLTNQMQQLLSSCEQLVDKVGSWVQQGSSVLSKSSEAGRQLLEAKETLNTHLQLHTQAESAGHDAEHLKQVLDQIKALHTDRTIRTSSSRQLSPLKALTEQLKRGGTGSQTRAKAACSSPPAAGSLSPELGGRVDLVLKELQSLNRKINSNLQLLQPYVTFLQMAQQVEEEMEELREIYRRKPEAEEEGEEQRQEEKVAVSSNIRTTTSSRAPLKKKQVHTFWQETLQRLHIAQELGNNYVNTVTMESGSGLNLQSMVLVVRQTIEQLNRTKQEVNELQRHHQIQVQQQQEDMKYYRKYQERLLKTLQDLNSVSELLDSCTLLDLGSDLETSRLMERFSQARPHFSQLDAEVEHMMKSWGTLRGVQDRLDVKEGKGGTVTEEDLSELLKLQKRVKDKIQQSESILNLTSSFHLTVKQMEALLHSGPADPLTGSTASHGSSEAELNRQKEEQQQIQSLFKTASALKTDICTTVTHSGWAGFRLEQLEHRLLSLDSLCVSWLSEAAQREENLRRELLTRLLNDDINQLRDSFKELKKRFSNLKFNYLKRNDRTRNMKAVRNQLQQVKLYEEKLQVLRKRLQGVTARLGSEVKDGVMTREVEDAINELQRQMGEFERSVREHQKTLDMTCRLQQAMEEYQFWCEEASATIARVGKFSSECRSTEAVSVLYRQFEKFVWPTVPQQEERISQITELAVRLHGAEEGRRYIEKTVSKHSEMVESIRGLSDGLMKLEAKLKLESLKQKQNDGEKDIKEEGEMEQRRESETEEKDEEKENKLKENRKRKKKQQTDNRSTQEATDMYELKETGHTPELTAEHDGKEVPAKRQTAASRKPPLQKNRSQEADRQTVTSESSHRQQLSSEKLTSSYCSTHTFSLSRSPVDVNRLVHTIHSQLQPVATDPQATPPPSGIGPSFTDIQRDFQRKEVQETGQDASTGGLSEAELQQQEVMTEDSLSNDEYECVSPDDISLPPLAETPESSMAQSDIEEGYCFSSHSIHINQYSQQYHVQSEHSGTLTATGAVHQERESSQTEGYPTPPVSSLHSSTRFRSESTLFVQSPLAVPAPSLLTSTLCTILRTEETSTANISQIVDLSLDSSKTNFVPGSNPVHNCNTTDSCYSKENDVPDKRTPSKTEPLNDHKSQYNQPQRSTGTQDKSTPNLTYKSETFPQTDGITHPAELDQCSTLPKSSYCPQPFNGPDSDLHMDKIPLQKTRILKCGTIFPQIRTVSGEDKNFTHSVSDSKIGFNLDINSCQIREETSPVSKPQRDSFTSTSRVTQQTISMKSSLEDPYCDLPQASSSLSSPHESLLFQSKTLPQNNLVPLPRGFAQSPSFADSAVHKDNNLPRDTYQDSRSGLDQGLSSSQTSKETSSVNKPQNSNHTTATTITQQSVNCQSSPSDSCGKVPQASSTFRSKKESPSTQGSGDLPDAHAPNLPELNNIDNISISSSTITSRDLHESLTSTCTQQCMHDHGMTPSSSAKPAAPGQPGAQTQALALQANPHVTPPSSPPHLLTSDQDPDICQPMAIREEIRLTPQIQGPPLPALPLPRAQTESLPQGKASKAGPPCFTRPLSRATVMEGSPVTLEVEVTRHPEPTLTWFKDGGVSATSPVPAGVCKDGKHFLFVTKSSNSDDGIHEAHVANHHDSQRTAGNSSSSSDKWLMAEVFDIISADWQTWFGTLCVLLWLLYLIVL